MWNMTTRRTRGCQLPTLAAAEQALELKQEVLPKHIADAQAETRQWIDDSAQRSMTQMQERLATERELRWGIVDGARHIIRRRVNVGTDTST
jgi:hypothetical protein